MWVTFKWLIFPVKMSIAIHWNGQDGFFSPQIKVTRIVSCKHYIFQVIALNGEHSMPARCGLTDYNQYLTSWSTWTDKLHCFNLLTCKYWTVLWNEEPLFKKVPKYTVPEGFYWSAFLPWFFFFFFVKLTVFKTR